MESDGLLYVPRNRRSTVMASLVPYHYKDNPIEVFPASTPFHDIRLFYIENSLRKVEYLMGKGSDQALKQASFKAKVKKIIRRDKKYIQRKFSNLKYREYPIEEFFLEKIFQDQFFLYPFDTCPQDKSDELYKRFQEYVLAKGMDLSSIYEDENFRTLLEDCVGYHNTLVHQTMLDPSQRLLEKDIKEYMAATGYAGHTLDPMAEALADNPDLEYTHRQTDGILRALRMDLRFHRLSLVMCTI